MARVDGEFLALDVSDNGLIPVFIALPLFFAHYCHRDWPEASRLSPSTSSMAIAATNMFYVSWFYLG